jgi:methyl-accepting chemotaxis protein
VATRTDTTAVDERAEADGLRALVAAIEVSQPIIEFDLSGVVLRANDAFLAVVGYTAKELVGQHHRLLCDPEYADSADVTTSVNRLSTAIDEVAGVSATAADLSTQTQGNAEHGVEALRASLAAIGLIERSSRDIADVVRMMSEIANQTNLLAFNASIEAARAGDHGVGFAVVASEVRRLAERSAEAAKQVGQLVADAGERVREGAEVSKQAESAFERIVASVNQTNEAISRISASTRVQQEASHEVDRLISQLANAHAG